MLPDEREIAGLRCSEVLERLSDFVDGDVSAHDESRIRAHVANCTVCERFGGAFAALVVALRSTPEEDVDAAVVARLTAHLSSAMR